MVKFMGVSKMGKPVYCVYRNYRGETEVRHVYPLGIVYTANEWHTEPQWILNVFDIDKSAVRGFTMSGIVAWDITAAEVEAYRAEKLLQKRADEIGGLFQGVNNARTNRRV